MMSVTTTGLEPVTFAMSMQRSSQLSYAVNSHSRIKPDIIKLDETIIPAMQQFSRSLISRNPNDFYAAASTSEEALFDPAEKIMPRLAVWRFAWILFHMAADI